MNPTPSSASREQDQTKKYPLSEVSVLKLQEALILKDILYALQGLEGNYIRYSKRFDSEFDGITGPNYNVTKHLDPSLSDMTKKLILLGKFYYGLNAFVEIYSDEQNGKVTQSLCHEIRQLLKEYLEIISNVECEFETNHSYTLRGLLQELNEKISMRLTHCYELVVFIDSENKQRAQNIVNPFDNLIQDIKNDLQQTGSIDLHSHSSSSRIVKGGLILKTIEKRIQVVRGDPRSVAFLYSLYDKVSEHYLAMLNDWLLIGEFQDLYDEFLIKLSDDNGQSVYTESYWDTKFVLRKEGLLHQFLNREIQYKILFTGKYLNILKECGVNVRDIQIPENVKITSLNSDDFFLQVDLAYRRANELVIDLYFNGLNLFPVLESLKRFYLLDNTHNIDSFINLSLGELRKPHDLVSQSKLSRNFSTTFAAEEDMVPSSEDLKSRKMIFELLNLTIEPNNVYDYLLEILNYQPIDADEALSSSNMSFLKTLLNKTLASEKGSRPISTTNTKMDGYCINRLNFEITLPFPLNLIITKPFTTQYELVFRHLMIIKFVDKSMELSWKEINHQRFWIYTYKNNKVNKWILKSRVLHSKMKDFLKLLQFYLSNDVIESGWLDFQNFVNGLSTDGENFEFEKVYTNLQTFVNAVFTNSFLSLDRMIGLINRIFSIIILYSNFLNSLRKTLVLLDENLFNEYESKISDKGFDANKNVERVNKLGNILNNYKENFDLALAEFNSGLKYYGETGNFTFLQLNERLELSGMVNMGVY